MRRLPQLTAGLVCAAVFTSATIATAQPAATPQLTEGPANTAVGQGALASNTTGVNNAAVGVETLKSNTDGYANAALGFQALRSNTSGFYNTAVGTSALTNNFWGNANTAIGTSALWGVTTGSNNVAIGFGALFSADGNQNTVVGSTALSGSYGSANTAVGYGAGNGGSNGWYNIYLGTVAGEHSDTQTMRLGMPDDGNGAGQTRTFIAGIAGTALTSPAVPVYINANGQLGTVVPTAPPGVVFPVAPAGASQPPLQAQAATIAALERRLADVLERLARLERGQVRRGR